MNYPDNFETPAFPAGTRIASTRAAAIGIALVFLLTLFVCGMLVWSVKSSKVHPFLVATNTNPNEWRIVGHDHGRRTITAMRALQESLVAKYIDRRFFISDDPFENDAIWSACEMDTDCVSVSNTEMGKNCDLFCSGTEAVFTTFANNVLPDYQARAALGERWVVDSGTLRITPSNDVGNAGGTWRATFTVQSNLDAPIDVVAYVKIARNIKAYPRTMGFHIVDFNAYRMN